jgi:hypothetical protein
MIIASNKSKVKEPPQKFIKPYPSQVDMILPSKKYAEKQTMKN